MTADAAPGDEKKNERIPLRSGLALFRRFWPYMRPERRLSLGILLLLWIPFLLMGVKGAIKKVNESTQQLVESIKKVAEWSEYAGSQTEESVKQIERLNKVTEDAAATSRKRTQAQAAQAVQLGKLMQQQIEAIERNG